LYWVYVLQSSKDSRFYTGVTSDLRRRIREHNSGKVRSTKARRPLSLVYTEIFQTKNKAFAREAYFKTPEGGVLKQQLAAQRRNSKTSVQDE
jgi:putative endonuclease